MALAKEEREMVVRGEGCLGKAADDEPVFVLRAQDRFLPVILDLWINLAMAANVNPKKIEEAQLLLDKVRRWQFDHFHNVKIPD